jgi:membrane glycosyltransferase
LIRRTSAFLNNRWCKGFLAAFAHLTALGITPVSRLR